MNDSYETSGRDTMARIATKQPHELLLMLGGALTILLTLVLTGLLWYPKLPTGTALQTQAVSLVINIVLGAALYVSAAIVRKNLRSEEHTSELQSQSNLVCRLLLEKKKMIS